MTKPLWTPSEQQIQSSLMSDFIRQWGQKGSECHDYQSLWCKSVEDIEGFWDFVWDFCQIKGEKGGVRLENSSDMMGASFFPQAKLNYAENLLQRRDDRAAIISRDEKGDERVLTFEELYNQVSLWQQAFVQAGLKAGDRVAGYMPNIPETVIAALAVVSIGAIWSSASPDFGVQGVLDRFGQIEPKILVAVDGYYYNGKVIDCLGKIKEIQPGLKSLEKIVIVPFAGSVMNPSDLAKAMTSDAFVKEFKPQDIKFERVAFKHPLFIMFSSGTTGVPKCIVHGHGGTLIQHLKEFRLHCDVRPDDRVFYFTTCGWMMWNWLISGLASGACLMLYDGSPFYPDGHMLWDYAARHKCTFFGASAKYIDALKAESIHPMDKYDLSSIRTIASTGSPLVHESFDFVYQHIKKDVHLASISGGTDIISSFMMGNPISPVWRGELQGAGLGLALDVFDDDGKPVRGQAGELVCTKPFPSMPVCFWNDPENEKYRAAYFERFPNIWCHGDWVEKTVHDGFIIYGRSDATLNPGGVRIGTAEIYRQVEQIEAVRESIAVGQDWDGDVRVILFVVLKPRYVLSEDLVKEIKAKIRSGASPRHVPAKILQVEDIPRTKSGKLTELAVRHVIHGRAVKNVEALANPESLELYKNLKELQG